MPKSEKKKVKVTAQVDQDLKEQIDEAMDELGMKSRPEFIRMALAEKIKHVLGKAKKLVKEDPPLAAALVFPFFPLKALPVMLVLFWIALICYYTTRLVRAESPEEQARAQRVLAGCVIAGVLMAVAKPVAFWATGWTYDPATDTWYDKNGDPVDIPEELVDAVDRLLSLLMYIGVIVVIGGLIYSGIQLSRTEKPPKTVQCRSAAKARHVN